MSYHGKFPEKFGTRVTVTKPVSVTANGYVKKRRIPSPKDETGIVTLTQKRFCLRLRRAMDSPKSYSQFQPNPEYQLSHPH